MDEKKEKRVLSIELDDDVLLEKDQKVCPFLCRKEKN